MKRCLVLILAVFLCASACAGTGLSPTANSVITGGALGAGTGAAIGVAAGNPAAVAAIGGGVGTLGGLLYDQLNK